MRSRILLTTTTFLIVLFAAQSCSQLSFTQRRYSRGINIDWAGRHSEKDKTADKKKEKQNSTQSEKEAEIVVEDNEVELEEDLVIATPEFVDEKPLEKEESTTPEISISRSERATKSEVIKSATREKNGPNDQAIEGMRHRDATQSHSSRPESDVVFIILVILAIIIPPLAVFLNDGEVNTLFWITLILCILGSGFFIGFSNTIFGLYGIAAILALLRVFDAI